jgi:hypothetical protein
MSDPTVSQMLDDVLLYRHELSDDDQQFVDWLEVSDLITQRDYVRLHRLYLKTKGETSHD